MYSHGSSARVGVVGKRGHGGGRPYRPPRERRDPNAVPPPLKECSCLVEIHLPEYREPQPLGRHHDCFGGRTAMERCHRAMRSDYQVHFTIPGKKQQGPVSMVAKSYREALPALAWLFEHYLTVNNINNNNDDDDEPVVVVGRIHRNVKDDYDRVLEGSFPHRQRSSTSESPSSLPFWLFQSPEWSVLACNLGIPSSNNNNNNNRNTQNNNNNNATDPNQSSPDNNDGHPGQDQAVILQTCLDNIVFRLGKEAVNRLDIFLDPYLEYSFAAGLPSQAEVLRREITTAFETTVERPPTETA